VEYRCSDSVRSLLRTLGRQRQSRTGRSLASPAELDPCAAASPTDPSSCRVLVRRAIPRPAARPPIHPRAVARAAAAASPDVRAPCRSLRLTRYPPLPRPRAAPKAVAHYERSSDERERERGMDKKPIGEIRQENKKEGKKKGKGKGNIPMFCLF
jgi:hypothetical protein